MSDQPVRQEPKDPQCEKPETCWWFTPETWCDTCRAYVIAKLKAAEARRAALQHTEGTTP